MYPATKEKPGASKNSSQFFCGDVPGSVGMIFVFLHGDLPYFPQQFLYFRPLPQGQGALRAGLPEAVLGAWNLPRSICPILSSGSM